MKGLSAFRGIQPRKLNPTSWLSHEVAKPAVRRRPAVAWFFAVTAMLVGTGNNVLLLKSGATSMPASVTGFLTDVAASTTLWVVVRPKLRQVPWRVVRVVLIFGCTSSVSVWSGQEALHHAPYAMVAVLALVVGPMTAALASKWRQWKFVTWVVVSAVGATLVYGVQAWNLSALGMIAIFLNGAMYWSMVSIFTRLGRTEQGTGRDQVFVASALSGLVTVPIMGVVFLLADGPQVVSTHTLGALGALGVGTLATITAVCASAGWKRGMSVSAHAQLQPAKPVLALMWGSIAGQKHPKLVLETICGYLLVVLGAAAVGRLFVEEKQKSPDQIGADKAASAATNEGTASRT
jgi:threonine/homoserine efflux transporter RhtA